MNLASDISLVRQLLISCLFEWSRLFHVLTQYGVTSGDNRKIMVVCVAFDLKSVAFT